MTKIKNKNKSSKPYKKTLILNYKIKTFKDYQNFTRLKAEIEERFKTEMIKNDKRLTYEFDIIEKRNLFLDNYCKYL